MSQPPGTRRYGQSSSGNFGVINKKSNTGAKLGTVVVLVVIFGGGGYGYHFYEDVPGQVRHIDTQDGLAVPAALVQGVRGASPSAVAALRKGLSSGRAPLKKACAKALGTTKDPENTAFLGAAVLSDGDAGVRAAAIRAIGMNGDVNCSRYMPVALADPSDEVKLAAAEAVGNLRLDNYIPDLIGFLGHYDGNLKNVAREALETFMPPGLTFKFSQSEWNKWYEGEY